MGAYTTAHADPHGAGDARPTALQIIHDEGLQGKLGGKVIVLTGAASGIGLETARALSATGATLFLTTRNVATAQTALAGILDAGRVALVEMDNASFASVRAAAATILAKANNHVNVLVNNAGVMGVQHRTLTADGHELHFATNHLSGFLLFQLLKPALLASATPGFCSRVVNVSSSAHRAGRLPGSDNYGFERGGYDHRLAYANSKIAGIYAANAIDRRYGSRGVRATSLHPGAIDTNISRHLGPGFVRYIMADERVVRVLKSPAQGAATTVLAAVGREWEGRGGRYLEDCDEATRGKEDGDGLGSGYVGHTYDVESEERLWRDSVGIVGVGEDEG